MSFPDQSHINRIRDSLWLADGRASVMVGAGLSRNARPIRPDARAFPLWRDVTRQLCEQLYPASDGDRQRRALDDASGTSGFLRLGQEYEAAFGRGALHNLIRDVTPDEDHAPSEFHERLLRLPWADVFTTNWDTLLERGRSSVADRFYEVVRTVEELPTAVAPRIVKLHGSFPAHVPYIFTEEDYRTYPRRFAPFVNTVQQAMMETAFLLVGFSGDDPNFLHWSGWVRDNLGSNAPKIYLAGWLDLSPQRRRMLEDRNVVPIDLANHPKAQKWPDHQRHQYALEWLLLTLERGRPYDPSDWPSVPEPPRYEVPPILEPVEARASSAPLREPSPNTSTGSDAVRQVREVVPIWKHNRQLYPGWVVTPPSKLHPYGIDSYQWERLLLKALPSFTVVERLHAISEFVWRTESALDPISNELETAIREVLSSIDIDARTISGRIDTSLDWGEIRRRNRELALALLTSARLQLDQGKWDECISQLTPYRTDTPDVSHRIHYEELLRALLCSDFVAVDHHLARWQTDSGDIYWSIRKASVLVELDRNDEAIQMLNAGLKTIREGNRPKDLSAPSREAWALWMALGFERGMSSTAQSIEAPSAFRRWRRLGPLNCNAFEQKQDMLNAVKGESESTDAPSFDLGSRKGSTVHFTNKHANRLLAAYRAIRLSEWAAMPPQAAHLIVASDLLRAACGVMVRHDLLLALRLSWRLASGCSDKTFNRIWTRSRIASLSSAEVGQLTHTGLQIVQYALSKAVARRTRHEIWTIKLGVAFEALSRLILRAPSKEAKGLMLQAMKHYRIEALAVDHWISKAIRNLFSRTWEALDDDDRATMSLELLRLPIVGLDDFKAADHYLDPGELLLDEAAFPSPPRDASTEPLWVEAVQLVLRGLRKGGEARRRASRRLAAQCLLSALTPSERDAVATAVWGKGPLDKYGLPPDMGLMDWVLLLLPEVVPGNAETLLRAKWFEAPVPSEVEALNDSLTQIGTGLGALRRRGRGLGLSESEVAAIVERIRRWLESRPPKLPWLVDRGFRDATIGIQEILVSIELPVSVAAAILNDVSKLNEQGRPPYRLFAGLARSLPSQVDRICMLMRMALASGDIEIAESSIIGLHTWLIAHDESPNLVPTVQIDLVREIGVAIVNRKAGSVSRALVAAQWIYSKGTNEQRLAIAELVIQGLTSLLEELRYDRERPDEEDEDVPLLRWACARLAVRMAESGYANEPVIQEWKSQAINDPMPEVRRELSRNLRNESASI